ncbi:MAG: hypothetical protein NTU98_05495 [Bacteroidetes bacterium]|nr:hypothetical protein [Bacteroidota bacterium]
MKTTFKIIVLLIALMAGTTAYSQDRVYKDGSVWDLSIIKTTTGMGDSYITNLKSTWKAVQDEALKQGLILSYKILAGSSANEDDFDMLLMVEYKNLASMENNDDKWDAIYKKVVGDQTTMEKLRDSRVNMRTILGEKLMREVVYK